MSDNEERIGIDLWAPLKTCRLEKLAGDYDRAAVSDSGHSVIFARFRCSECGRVFWFDKHGEIAYCPKCGAKDVWR